MCNIYSVRNNGGLKLEMILPFSVQTVEQSLAKARKESPFDYIWSVIPDAIDDNSEAILVRVTGCKSLQLAVAPVPIAI